MKKIYLIISFLIFYLESNSQQWTKEQAWDWYNQQPYLIGCNYTPAYACNQIEFWQKESFDTVAIDKELALCEKWGINTLRVFLHFLVWQNDPEFKNRINTFLNLTKKHKIKPLIVFWDDCWNEKITWGKQPPPKACTHNSQWLVCPGNALKDSVKNFPILLEYVQDIISYFKNDTRILMWDLYNEIGSAGRDYKTKSDVNAGSLELLKASYKVARKIRPIQPITTCYAPVSKDMDSAFYHWQTKEADVFTFHDYSDYKSNYKFVEDCKRRADGRPMICTEYMARKYGSTFSELLPLYKENNIGALNWGCVSGKTNTKFPWENNTCDPQPWFHEIFTETLEPYRLDEVKLIKLMAELPKYSSLKLIPILPTADENSSIYWYYTNKQINNEIESNYFASNDHFDPKIKFDFDNQHIFQLGKSAFGYNNPLNKGFYEHLKIVTNWDTLSKKIFLIRQLPVTDNLTTNKNAYLRLIYNKKVTVYINGEIVFNGDDFPNKINNYIYYPIPKSILAKLKKGEYLTISAKGISEDKYAWLDIGLYVEK